MPDFEKQWQHRFERFAQGNTEAEIAGWSDHGLSTRLHFFKTWVRPQADEIWLDVGCGAGTYTRTLHQMKAHCFGLDYSMPSLEKAKKLTNLPVWCHANATCLPIGSNQVDGVLCFGVLQVLSDFDSLFDELIRVCHHNGEIWLDGLNSYCLVHIWDKVKRKLFKKSMHLHYTSPFKVQKKLKPQASKVQLYWVPICPAPVRWLQPLLSHPKTQPLMRAFSFVSMWFCHSYTLRVSTK